MRARVTVLGVAAACALAVPTASADSGAWIWLEYRQPIHAFERGMPRLSWRFATDTRFSAAAGGLAQQFTRTGPLLELDSWFFIAAHGTIIANRERDGSFQQEARLEVEPTFTARWWRFTFVDRNRFEFRWTESASTVRYRNLLRVNYAPVGQRWIPFVWNEWLIPLDVGFDQNRLAAGLAWMIRPHVRIEAAYLLRSRKITAPDGESAWSHDNLALASLFVGWPAGW